MDELTTLITNYTPSDETVELVRDTQMLLLCGITGAGKNTVAQEILKDPDYTPIVTSTTRKPRTNDGVMEIDGKDYYFFEHADAVEKIRKGEYFEVALVHGLIYGSTKDEIRRIHDAGKIAISDIDYHGIEYYKKYSPDIMVIFLVPPSYDIWIERLKMRHVSGEDFKSAWTVRRESAIKELQWALSTDLCRIIVNDEFHKTCEIVQDIMEGKSVETDGRTTAESLLQRLNTI